MVANRSPRELGSRAPIRPRRSFLYAAAVLAVGWLAGSRARADQSSLEFRVVVHPSNPETAVSRAFLTGAFLKKTARWDDGETIRPVDLRADSAVRRRFSVDVLKRSVEAVRHYWQQRIFSGRGLPPPELDSDDDVVRFVAKHAGAIGYVSLAAKVDAVKVLSVR